MRFDPTVLVALSRGRDRNRLTVKNFGGETRDQARSMKDKLSNRDRRAKAASERRR